MVAGTRSSKAHVLGVRIVHRALSEPRRTIPLVRCPRCDGERVLLAAAPGQQPGAMRVCLECAALWEGPEDED